MISLRVRFASLFILVWLVACGPAGGALISPSAVSTAQHTPGQTATATEVPPALTATLEPTVTWTATITSTVPITTSVLPTTTVTVMPGGIPEITPGVGITTTSGVSQTVLISTTTVLTKTWTFTDVLAVQSGLIRQIAWNREGDLLAVGTSVGLFLLDGKTMEIERTLNVGDPVQAVAFSPLDGLLVSGSLRGDIQWWDPDTGKYGGAYQGGQLGVNSLAFSTQGEILVSGSDDGTMRVWNPTQEADPASSEVAPLHTWRASDRVGGVDLNQNVQLAVAASNQEISIWDLATGEPLQTLRGLKGWVREVAISPNGGYIAAADSSNHLRLWNTTSFSLTHDIPLEGFESITALDFSPNGLMIALGGVNGRVVLWNLASNILHDPEIQYPSPVTDIIFHPRERNLVSSYRDGLIRLWSYQP